MLGGGFHVAWLGRDHQDAGVAGGCEIDHRTIDARAQDRDQAGQGGNLCRAQPRFAVEHDKRCVAHEFDQSRPGQAGRAGIERHIAENRQLIKRRFTEPVFAGIRLVGQDDARRDHCHALGWIVWRMAAGGGVRISHCRR